MTDAYLLETADRVTRAKKELDLSAHSVSYYKRVLVAAEARYDEKQAALVAALVDLKALGGEA
jgi:hypothetical protein